MKRIGRANIRRLKEVKVGTLDAYTVSDDGFLKWFLRMMGGIDSTNRLEFRLTLLSLLDELRTKSGRARHNRKIVYEKNN